MGTVLSQKPRRWQRFSNESSFARSDAEQRPNHAETVRDLGEDGGAKHVVERLSKHINGLLAQQVRFKRFIERTWVQAGASERFRKWGVQICTNLIQSGS